MNILILPVFVLTCVEHASLKSVWDDHSLVKPVYVWSKPKILRAEHGISHQPNHPRAFQTGFQVFPIGEKNEESQSIPPYFITGARLEPENERFTERILTKPKRWAISKIYRPPTEYEKEFESMDHNYDYDDDFEDENFVKSVPEPDRDLTQTHNQEDVTDLTYEQPLTPTYEEQYSSQNVPETLPDPRLIQGYTSTKFALPHIEKYTMEPFLPRMKEPENTEPVHQIRRPPTIWPVRDIYRIGEPRHIPCTLALHRGMGPDSLSSWYYDSSEHRCRWFGYRGHGGNANRFYSRKACEAHCIQDLPNMCDVVSCSWPGSACKLVEDRVCKDNEYQYNRDWRLKCPPDQPVCMSRRGTKMAPDLEFKQVPMECMQPKNSGSCERQNPALNFYYDPIQHTCLTFYFHNCGGNDNRFETKSDCMTYCAP